MQPTTQVRLMAGSTAPLTTQLIQQNQTLLNQRFPGVSTFYYKIYLKVFIRNISFMNSHFNSCRIRKYINCIITSPQKTDVHKIGVPKVLINTKIPDN